MKRLLQRTEFTARRVPIFHMGFWGLAGLLLFLSGLTHLSFERALFRNGLMAVLGCLLTWPLLRPSLLNTSVYLRLTLLLFLAILAAAMVNFSGYFLFEGSLEGIEITIFYRGFFNFFLIFVLWGILQYFLLRPAYKSDASGVAEPKPGLWASRGRERIFVPYRDIHFIRAAGDYAELETVPGKCLLRETLASLEKALAPHGFLRVHRSLIVNMHKIDRITKAGKGSYRLQLSGGQGVATGRNYRAVVEQALTGRKAD